MLKAAEPKTKEPAAMSHQLEQSHLPIRNPSDPL